MAPLLLLLLTPLCRAEPAARVQYVMGTLCEITAYGRDAEPALSEAFAEISKWDAVLSLYKEQSEASRFNRSNGAWFECSRPFWEALTLALKYAKESGGAFDPTILAALQ